MNDIFLESAFEGKKKSSQEGHAIEKNVIKDGKRKGFFRRHDGFEKKDEACLTHAETAHAGGQAHKSHQRHHHKKGPRRGSDPQASSQKIDIPDKNELRHNRDGKAPGKNSFVVPVTPDGVVKVGKFLTPFRGGDQE